jgi:hypothetical protein
MVTPWIEAEARQDEQEPSYICHNEGEELTDEVAEKLRVLRARALRLTDEGVSRG